MEYVHPGLLSTEEILRILKEREIFFPNMEALSRYELLNVFSKFAVPMSQRRCVHYPPTNHTNSESERQEHPLQKRPLSPTENDYCAKFSRITLRLNFNSTVQKRNLQEESNFSTPKKQRVT